MKSLIGMESRALLLLLAVLVATSYAAKKYSVSASGKVTCRMADGSIEPLKLVVVKLLDHDTLAHDKFGETRTKVDGSFSVSGSARDLIGKPDPFIQVVYDYQGAYGRMEIDGFAGVTRKYSTPKKKYAPSVNFGNIQISDDHCRAYVQFYKALKDYYIRTGSKVPYQTLHVRTHVLIHGGTPYAIRSRVNLPRGYTITFSTAKHELGHTVRHTLDGSLAHFLFDVARFNYLRHHTCSTKSNPGYAFNEGFAEFWANDCLSSSYGGSPLDYSIEGNVANALRSLKQTCGLTDGQIIKVLKDNPKKIHSFNDFKKASSC